MRLIYLLGLIALLSSSPSASSGPATLAICTSTTPAEDRRVQEIVKEIRAQETQFNAALFKRLTAIGTRESLEAIQALCDDLRAPKKLEYAFLAFENYRGDSELEPEAIAWLSEECRSSKLQTQRAAARGLATFGAAAEHELHGVASRSKDPEVRAFAVGGLLEVLTAERSRANLTLLLESMRVGLSGTREALLEALECFEGSAYDGVFASALKSRRASLSTKLLVIDVLSAREGEEARKTLLAALKSKDGDVKIAAMVALDARGEQTHGSTLAKLTRSREGRVQRQAVISLGRLKAKDPDLLEDLLEFATSRSPSARTGAAVALGELRTPEAISALHRLLADPDHLVRREALQQIGNLRRKQSLPVLISRLNAERGRLKADLLTTLRLFTGLDHGTGFARWKRWWDHEGATFELPTYEAALSAERERGQRDAEGRTTATFYGLRIVSDRICFILDVSGSMLEDSGRQTRMDAAREQLVSVVESVPEGDLFNLIFFSSDAFAWSDELVIMSAETRAEALDYVQSQRAGGATAVYDALELAFQDRNVDTIYLLTDGEPAGGTVNDPAAIRAEVARWNRERYIRIHGIAVGKPSALLQGLSKDSGGDYKEVR